MFDVPHFDRYWDKRAEELRGLATRTQDENDKGVLLGIADDCQKLSLIAEMRIRHARTRDVPPPPTESKAP
jgi:hypothetical protein